MLPLPVVVDRRRAAYGLADTAIDGHLGPVPLGWLAIATTALTMTS